MSKPVSERCVSERCGHPAEVAAAQWDGQRWRCAECKRVYSRRRYYRLKGVRLTDAQFAATGRKRAV